MEPKISIQENSDDGLKNYRNLMSISCTMNSWFLMGIEIECKIIKICITLKVRHNSTNPNTCII